LSFGERNTGDPATLVDFVKWGVERAPAQHYLLQMWGHGRGFQGSQFDNESDDGALTIKEFATALGTPGMPTMDVVAYDSCLMGMAEVGAGVAKAFSGVFVASEELIEDAGQNYTTAYARLNVVDPASVTAIQLADGMVASFEQVYQGNPDKRDTLSAIATSGYADLNKAIAGFVSACRGLGAPQRNVMIAAAKAIPAYGKQDDHTNADLAGFMANIESAGSLPPAVREAASGVRGAILSMVTSKTRDQRGSGGVAIFLPTDGAAADLADYSSDASAFCQATGWDRFARWMATGAGITSNSSAGSSLDSSRIGVLLASIPEAAWAAYASEVAFPADTHSPMGARRIRV